MFTGIITDVGRLQPFSQDRPGVFQIACAYDPASIAIGASIACDGCCLTVTELSPLPAGGCVFSVDVSNETLAKTTLGGWQPGQAVNLERALGLGAELGGHIVTGHVDAVAVIVERFEDGNAVRFVVEAPAQLQKFIAPKGSVALNGVSLTVNEVEGARFGISLIPHTLQQTNWKNLVVNDKINLEVDLLARYVARMYQLERAEKT